MDITSGAVSATLPAAGRAGGRPVHRPGAGLVDRAPAGSATPTLRRTRPAPTPPSKAATLHERARGLDAELQKLRADLAQLRSISDAMRHELDATRDERAQLTERAARVPVLDAQLARASEAAAMAQQRILELSTREAELARERDGHRARHAELAQELQASRRQLAEQGQSLAESQSQRAELATR